MNLIRSISVKNFKAIKEEQRVNLLQGSYVIGANNSGKTTILQAIDFFFDKKLPETEEFLNRSTFAAKKGGYNKCEISLEIDFNVIISKNRKKRLINEYSEICKITKSITFREKTKTCLVRYSINGQNEIVAEDISQDLRSLLNSVKITYLHPQDGIELLRKAQEKLKDRLILNWGRRGGVTTDLEKLKKDWQSLRLSSSNYLSRTLSTKLQDIWPGCEVKINLPKKIEEIIKVSDIGVKGSKHLPEIALTSQGTGAQSMVLYLAHFLLDSDRSLHRGEYHPLWLIEEPESFLHADLMFRLGKQLASMEWLDNIQMVVSTHSPIILACSREAEDQVIWVTTKLHSVVENKPLKKWTDADIENIGAEMGDSNFALYFTYSENRQYFLFLEDSRSDTKSSFERSGFTVTKGLKGTSEINKHIETYPNIVDAIQKNVFFIIDNDLGQKDFRRYLKKEKLIDKKEEIKKYEICKKMYILLLPKNYAVEDLFEEFDNFLQEKVDLLYKFNKKKNKYFHAKNIPANLSKTHAKIRETEFPESLEDAKNIIKNTKDVKDLFWEKVSNSGLVLAKHYEDSLKFLMEI